jgi:hypothetical protein
MSQSYNTENRVTREQDKVKETGQAVVDKAKELKNDIKDGTIKEKMNPENLPTTDKITTTLQKGEESLDRFQQSERGQQMGAPAQKVVDDIKQVLSDEETLLQQKNAGDLLQKMILHLWSLLQEMRRDPELKETFEDWQSNITSIFTSGDITEFFHNAGELFTSLKDTEEFLDLLSQLIDVLKTMISEKTEQVTSGEGFSEEQYKSEKAAERERIIESARATITSLSNNDVWRMFVQRGRVLGNKAGSAGETTTVSAKQISYRVKESENFRLLLDDFKTFLQRLVGDQRSVDALFDYSKKAAKDILENDELSYLVDELHILLDNIVENPALLDDDTTQERLSNLAERIDKAAADLKENPNIVGAKEESKQLTAAIKQDPANAQFLSDIKTLWHDIVSDKPGEIIDGDVMGSIRQMVVPLLLEHLNNVPLPAAKGTGSFLGKYSYTIDNMKLSLPALIPENIHLRFEMNLDAHPLELSAETKKTYLYLQASNIHAHLHGAQFSFTRTTIPKIHDTGMFDVDTVGDGMTIWMKMELKGDTKSKEALTVIKSDVKIRQNFRIKFHDSKHDTLYSMLTHIFAGKIKKNVIELLQEKLKMFGSYFSEQLMALIDQAKTKSIDFAKVAKEKKEAARHGIQEKMESIKLQKQETMNDPRMEEVKDSAKASAKGLLNVASGKVQEKLDEQKLRIEQQKREKELDKMMDDISNLPPNTQLYNSKEESRPSTTYPSQQSM